MTAQLLTSELSTLIQESKRKNPDLRTAAEKSLNDLKNLPRTSEAQIAADLKSRSFFVQPFILACGTRNAKFAGSAVICLQRLIIANALPREALEDVLGALRECSTLALDIQLKVLQALPSLLQNYSSSLTGSLLATAFQVCFLLYGSKTAVVSHTAAAALQQLVNSTFDKAAADEQAPWNSTPVEVPIEEGSATIWGSSLDAYNLLKDICLLTEGQKAKQFPGASLTQNFGLELLESILTNHVEIVTAHPEQIHVLHVHLMPLVTKILSDKMTFALTVRTMRLLQLVLRRLLFALASDCETALSLLNHMLDPDAATLWKRALCLEVFRSLHSEPALMRSIYAHFDEAEEKRNIVRDHLGGLVRLASEKPAIIGLGQQSSVPVVQLDDSGEQAAMQAGGLVGSIGASVTTTDINSPGISSRWSLIRTPCMDMLDKSEAPSLPATYIYSLALNCITSFSEGLARFMLPFTVPSVSKSKRRHTRTVDAEKREDSTDTERPYQEGRPEIQSQPARKVPINPLGLKDHVLYRQILTSAHMVDQCWPALLAASSTYLNATMDSEHFHALIRAFQKFTQIAGLLDLVTPRDAFLTTLGKHAVPSNTASQNFRQMPSADQNDSEEKDSSTREVDLDNPTPIKPPLKRQSTLPIAVPTMNTRHLLCLRALLNLGIALGPVLHKAWSIILEAIQQADLVISLSGIAQTKQPGLARRKPEITQSIEDIDGVEDLSLEVTAAETAASRMFESTSELPNGAFLEHLQCICALLRDDTPDPEAGFPNGMLSPGFGPRRHQKLRSISGTTAEASASDRESLFLLEKLGVVIQSNVNRLSQHDTTDSGWDLLMNKLVNTFSSHSATSEVRIKAASCFNQMIILTATSETSESLASQDGIRARSFEALLKEIRAVHGPAPFSSKASLQCEQDIHAHALDASRSILEHCGDSHELGWTSVFSIVNSIFDNKTSRTTDRSRPAKLVHSSFGSLQLICSDFLGSVPPSSLLQLLDTLFAFSDQEQELNISLTTTTFFRNISDFLLRDQRTIDLSAWVFDNTSSGVLVKVDLIDVARSASKETSTPALWLYLLSRLVQLTIDDRDEVRHSALRTLFRIFDSCSEQTTAGVAFVCFKMVIVKALSANVSEYTTNVGEGVPDDQARSWNDTALLLIEGTTKLFSQWVATFTAENDMAMMWHELLDQLDHFLHRFNLRISRTTFAGLAEILSDIDIHSTFCKSSVPRCWETWEKANPVAHHDDSPHSDGNQDALLAYLSCLGQLLRLTKNPTERDYVKDTLVALRKCITGSKPSNYTSDVDHLTHVQKSVLELLKAIPTKVSASAFELLECITFFVALAYQEEQDTKGRKQTYVALSKASMVLLESFVSVHLEEPDIDASKLLTETFTALAKPMHLKHKFQPEGKSPSPWRRSISAAVNILEASRTLVEDPKPDQRLDDSFWTALINVVDGILSADCDAADSVSAIHFDQDADIAAFSRIRTMIIPALGSPSIADSVRKTYAASLFQNSLLHEPHPDDLARPNTDLLSGLQSTHIGRVQDLPPSPRSKLAYTLLDELFALVAIHDNDDNGDPSSPEHISLAQAVAPYLILRCGLTLKAYIYDQPLRGLLPQPWSQKEEMLHVLRKLADLDSEPRAIPAAKGVTSRTKRHLHRLYPLLMRALRAAGRDEEVAEGVREVLIKVGQDYGV